MTPEAAQGDNSQVQLGRRALLFLNSHFYLSELQKDPMAFAPNQHAVVVASCSDLI